MLDIGLCVNDTQIEMGQLLKQETIVNAHLRRAGFFTRLMMKREKRSDIWWAKNCEIECLGGKVMISAKAHRTFGALMHGTSAYVFVYGRSIYKTIYQVIDNYEIAESHLQLFNQACTEMYGQPSAREGDITLWFNKESVITSELGRNGKDCIIRHMLVKEIQ